MGSKSSKLKKIKTNRNNQIKNKSNENILSQIQPIQSVQQIQSIQQKNKPINNDIPNPIFKYKKEFKFNVDETLNSIILEIYQLKNINNAIYLVSIEEKDIIIYKYCYESNNLEKITSIKIKGHGPFFFCHTIKYYYSPLDKKEYLFVVQNYNSKNIYLIKNENEFELIYENIIYDEDDSYLRSSLFEISDIYLFDIIYNKYDQNNYIITVYDYDKSDYFKKPEDKYIKIEMLKGNKVEYIDSLKYENTYLEIENLIYEDKHLKKYYIIEVENTNIEIIEIKEKYEGDKYINKFINSSYLINSEKDRKQLDYFFKNIIEINNKSNNDYNYISCFMCIVNSSDNNDYLYIINQEEKNNLIIIDLYKRNIVKNIYLNINKSIYGIKNWNNENIILIFDKQFCIYNINTFQIITKYFYGYLLSIKKRNSKDNSLYGIYVNPNILLYNKKYKNSLK